MKNSVNILIDANNFFNRTLFSTNFKNKNSRLFDEEEHGMYMRKLSTDLAAFLRRFKGNYSKVVVCVDSKSWRKVEPEFATVGYKAHRVKKEEINWEAYNKINDEFIQLITNVGLNVVKAYNTEADDLIRGYVDHFKAIGENSIVWSADNDLFQLVYYNEESFNIQYYQPPMGRNSIGATAEFFDWLNSRTSDDFDNSHSAEDILFNLAEMTKEGYNVTLKSLFNSAGLSEKVIDPLEVVYKKVIGGDASDGIDKLKAGVGKKTLENLWQNHYNGSFTIDQVLTEVYQTSMVDVLFEETKPKKFKEGQAEQLQKDLDAALVRIPLNVRLIVLDERTAPDYVNENIQKAMDAQTYTRINTEQIEDMKKLLNGTEHFDASKVNGMVPKGMDPFAGIEEAQTKKTKSLF